MLVVSVSFCTLVIPPSNISLTHEQYAKQFNVMNAATSFFCKRWKTQGGFIRKGKTSRPHITSSLDDHHIIRTTRSNPPPWQRRKSLTISRIQIPPVPPTSLDVVWNKRDFVEEYPLRSHPFHKRIRLRMYCWLDQIFTRVAESGHKCSGATSQFVAFGTDSICRIWWPIRSKFHPQSIDSHNEATRRFGHGVETVICTWN